MPNLANLLRGLAGAALTALAAVSPVRAQDAVAQFYKGKQINLYIGTSPGGGYDTYARLLARRFVSYIPGNPAIIPQNMPGAGSNKLASFMYSVAPKDGTAVGAIFSGAILQPLVGDTPTQHDPSKFIYLGNANNEVFVCFARADAPAKTFQDTFSKELIIGATNEGGSTRDFAAMLINVLGTEAAHRHRLCRQQRDHARDRAQRGAGPLRRRLVEHRRPACAVARPTGSASSSPSSRPKAIPR